MERIQVARSLLTALWLHVVRTPTARLRPLDFAPFDATPEPTSPAEPAADADSFDDLTIDQLQDRMTRGEVTAEQVTRRAIARIRRYDGSLCGIIELNPHALDEARAADDRRRAGSGLGPLDGIPVTLKDNIETAGPMRTTAGAVVLADHVASNDAPVVARLRQAGAVIIGKANLSELAGAVARTPGVSAVGGQTRNPYGAAFSTGGSSSGSAVAVAAGLCVVSVGTETSGSLIAPASFNGVVGMKPSHDLITTDGIVPLVRAQDSAGPMARCVADAAALLTVLAGGALTTPDLSDDALVGVRAGILRADILGQRTPYEDTADNDVVLDRIVAGLEAAGAEPVDTAVVTEEAMKELDAGFTKYVMGGLAHDTMGYLAAAGAPVSTVAELLTFNLQEPKVRMPRGQFFLALACLLAPDATAYRQQAEVNPAAAAAILDATFEAARGDLLVSITNRHSTLYASAGYPAVTVPVGLRANGMPTGVTLIGRQGDDARLLAWAHAFEQATHLRAQPHLTAG